MGEGEEGEISFVERENVKNIQTNKICYCLGKCKTSPLKTLPSFCCKKKVGGAGYHVSVLKGRL